MKAGDRVVCATKSPFFTNQVGVVVEPSNYGETGVQFSHDGPVFWFKAGELRYANGGRTPRK